MKEDNLVQEKSYQFAVRIVKLYQHLSLKKQEFVLSKQVLCSGTSIGSNIEEATGGQSRADFFAKLAIAYKEARETSYWLRLLKDSSYLTQKQFSSIHDDALELCKILAAIRQRQKPLNGSANF
ncbi:MAG: four helix bundle protein [Puniceicoccales bacterium]|jgi:four helix bundle protein|nr:four helix bundle protein [Puniceicoccales bacterium]